MKRKAITKKIRFEVFKRDRFTCQYCGESAPKVVLNVDHIIPVAKGGGSDILNLITSCFPCNSGKKDRVLSDDAVIIKQKKQADKIAERKEQIQMMAEWSSSFVEASILEAENYNEHLNKFYDVRLSDHGKRFFMDVIKKYGFQDVILATEKSANRYLKNSEDKNDISEFLDKIPGICYWQKRERENPEQAQLRKIAYTANKFWWTCKPAQLVSELIRLNKSGLSVDELYEAVVNTKGITQFNNYIEDMGY
jgi:hypothetical protein